MTEKKYPEEIYPRPSDYNGQKIMSITPKDLELAYDQGYRHGQLEVRRDGLDPVDTWTRLITSNPDWDRIDWEALYERLVLLRHVPSFSNVCTKIVSKGPYTVGYDDGPREIPAHQALLLKALPKMTHSSLHGATQAALEDRDGWALYVLGELPLVKQTADDLESGTIFEAVLTGEEEFGPATLLRVDAGIIDTGDWQALDVDLTCIEVSRVLGTFKTPEGDA